MAKAIYLGVDGKARKMKKSYIGIEGKARKIKKVYVGVDGKARLAYTSYTPVTGIKLTEKSRSGVFPSNSGSTDINDETYTWYISRVTISATISPNDATNGAVTWSMTTGSYIKSFAAYYPPFTFSTSGSDCTVTFACNNSSSTKSAYYTCKNNAGYAILTATTADGIVAKVRITASERTVNYTVYTKKTVLAIDSVSMI